MPGGQPAQIQLELTYALNSADQAFLGVYPEQFTGRRTPRFPQRPLISRRSEARGNVTFVIEYQFGWSDVEHWTTSWLIFASLPHSAEPFSERAPFGQFRQPHRWWIWTLDRSGEVSLSEWRTINFTN